jgi:hypothetical protein
MSYAGCAGGVRRPTQVNPLLTYGERHVVCPSRRPLVPKYNRELIITGDRHRFRGVITVGLGVQGKVTRTPHQSRSGGTVCVARP